jgi:hypothetical protein
LAVATTSTVGPKIGRVTVSLKSTARASEIGASRWERG